MNDNCIITKSIFHFSFLGSRLPSFLRRQESTFFFMDIMDPRLCWDDDMDGLLRYARNDRHCERSVAI